jgi:hypothetical protein
MIEMIAAMTPVHVRIDQSPTGPGVTSVQSFTQAGAPMLNENSTGASPSGRQMQPCIGSSMM